MVARSVRTHAAREENAAMPIVEPLAGDFEAEYRSRYQPEPTSHVGVIVQGSVGLTSALHGDDDDDTQKSHDVRLLVGPFW
jgi:hypothetical protein